MPLKLICDLTGNSVPPSGPNHKVKLELDVNRDGTLVGWETVGHNSWRKASFAGYETLSLSRGTAYYANPGSGLAYIFKGTGPARLKDDRPLLRSSMEPPENQSFTDRWCLTQ